MVALSFTTLSGFRALYEEQYGFVWSAVRRFGVPSPQVEDAVQDTFIVAYRRRSSFTPGPTRPWLYGIARGVASNYRRSARRVARKRRALADAAEFPRSPEHARASLQALDQFLDALSPEDRELFVLSEIEGLTGPELSTALQLATRTIYRRLGRLRARFATQAIEVPSKPRRPRASTAGWAALLPALRASKLGRLGWLGMGMVPKLAAVGGLVSIVAVGWAVTRSKSSPPVRRFVASTTGSAQKEPVETPVVETVVPQRVESSAEPDSRPHGVPAPTPPVQTRPLPPAPPSVDPLTRENALLQGAKLAVARGDFDVALAATVHHAAEFPSSAMSDLRTALRVEALCGAGKQRQARGEAHAFLTQNPHAPAAERIRRACVTKSGAAGQ